MEDRGAAPVSDGCFETKTIRKDITYKSVATEYKSDYIQM